MCIAVVHKEVGNCVICVTALCSDVTYKRNKVL